MTVFKNYLKITRAYVSIIIIYTLIFIVIAMITSQSGAMNQETYQAERTKIAIINHDHDSVLIQAFQRYIQDNAEYIELENSEDDLRDALFFRKVDYIMIVPQNFTRDFLNNQDVHIETMEVPDSYGSIYSKKLMNQYLNTAKLYIKVDIPISEMTDLIQRDLSIHSDVSMQGTLINHQMIDVRNFYNFSNYTFLVIIISVLSMVMMSIREEHIQNRQLIACLPYRKFNLQLLLGNVCVVLGVWLLYVLASFVMFGDIMLSYQGSLMIFNALIFVIYILVLSFLLTILIKNRNVVSGLATVIALGTSFISGTFVPQEFLSPFVLTIAKFTPSYWFITNNHLIAQLSKFSWLNMQPILMNMGIILGFAYLLFMIIQIKSYFHLKH